MCVGVQLDKMELKDVMLPFHSCFLFWVFLFVGMLKGCYYYLLYVINEWLLPIIITKRVCLMNVK